MDTVSTIRDLVNLWPRRADLAHDIEEIIGELRIRDTAISTARVHKWAEMGSIPPKYHSLILLAGQRRGFDISADLLVALHAPGRNAA